MKPIKTIIAAALALTAAAHAEQPRTEGHAQTIAFTCGDHFVQVYSVDNVITGGAVDDQKALVADVEHRAKNGVPSIAFPLLMNADRATETGTGYTINMDGRNGASTLTAVKFTMQGGKVQRTPTGKAIRCRA